MIKVNMNKAVEIKKEMLRDERKPLFESLDLQMMRNFSDPKVLSSIDAEKQKLRDVTDHPALTAATTPEELKAITLADLVE